MNFKAYDILSSLVPGFLALLVLLNFFNLQYDNDFVIGYTAIAFFLGYLLNTISSWLEGFYFMTWGGKPSSKMLDGKNIWKVNFYHGSKAKALLLIDAGNPNASNNELFLIAVRLVNGIKDTRVEDFNTLYAFSRALLTTTLLGTIFLLIENHNDWRYYIVLIPSLIIVWLRSKQRAYYYVREVLNVYLKAKTP
ncbi:hypothetical protein [Taibaiella koreensis]|uniref:hypothetical protein n=1 Tax=Taibaiella koreensis TaxID=1268548 RepID=UPI0019691849|nr:hypothetical protein [Taibaiella koreensis]